MIPEGINKNYQTILSAVKHKRLCVMEVFDSTEQKTKTALCAVNVLDDGEYEMIPLAIMIDEDPYERYMPPDGKDGFYPITHCPQTDIDPVTS